MQLTFFYISLPYHTISTEAKDIACREECMIWNPHYESMERETLIKIQSERLCELVDRVYRKVPFYRKRMDE